MPTNFGRKTTVQLSVADLGRATTPNPSIAQCSAASESMRNIAQEFARGSIDGTLTETPFYTEDGSHIRFLGKPGTMHFYMVHAGKNFFNLNTTDKEKRNKRPHRVPIVGKAERESDSTAIDMDGDKNSVETTQMEPNSNYKPPLTPHALCLTVFLSNSSFVRSENRPAGKKGADGVKIDVYLNGALCGSEYVPRRYSSDNYTCTEHIVRFTGSRIGRMIEKPWVFVPSGQNPDGSHRKCPPGRVADAGAQQRWIDISDLLIAEADKIGRNVKGERPVIGEYLESLAQEPMPKEVEDMHKAGSPKFGILDVVVIWGEESTNGPSAPCIVKPTPIMNEGFTAISVGQPMDDVPRHPIPRTTDSSYTTSKSRSGAIAKVDFRGDNSDTSPLSLTPTQITTPNTDASPSAPSPSNKRPHPKSSSEKPAKRSRGPHYDYFTTKKTLEEEFNSIAAATTLAIRAGFQPTFSINPRNAQISYASSADTSALSSEPVTRDPTPAQSKMPPPDNYATSPSMMSTPRMQDEKANSEFRNLQRQRRPASGLKPRYRGPTQLNANALDREFVTPALSVDCSITYAPDGIVRNVGAARGGVFKERGIVMGARFVVGG